MDEAPASETRRPFTSEDDLIYQLRKSLVESNQTPTNSQAHPPTWPDRSEPKQKQHLQHSRRLLLAEHRHHSLPLKTLQIKTLADRVPQRLRKTLRTTNLRNRTTTTQRTRNPTTNLAPSQVLLREILRLEYHEYVSASERAISNYEYLSGALDYCNRALASERAVPQHEHLSGSSVHTRCYQRLQTIADTSLASERAVSKYKHLITTSIVKNQFHNPNILASSRNPPLPPVATRPSMKMSFSSRYLLCASAQVPSSALRKSSVHRWM
jgi:hypothetical protein